MKKLFLFILLLPVFSFKPATIDENVFFGDSITFGNELGSLQYSARWSTQYCQAIPTDELNDAYSGEAMTPGLNPGRPVFNINAVPDYESKYRHIFVSYWVNDFLYGGTPSAYATATTNAVNGIIAKGWPASKIVLCFNYLPESSTLTHDIALQWLGALRGVQQAKGTSFLDFYTPIYNRPDNASYADDGIHPTAAWNTIMKQYALTTIEAPSSTLPVNLVNFSAQRQASATVLAWTVAQEQNVAYYEINRSADGINWNRAGEVLSAGNAATQRSYSFTDNNAAGGKQYYRLRIVDQNGATRFSNIVLITGPKTTQLSLSGLFPNPANSRLNIGVNTPARESLSIQLIDASGRTVKTQQEAIEAGSNTLSVNLEGIKAGAYFIKLSSEKSGSTAVQQFIKD